MQKRAESKGEKRHFSLKNQKASPLNARAFHSRAKSLKNSVNKKAEKPLEIRVFRLFLFAFKKVKKYHIFLLKTLDETLKKEYNRHIKASKGEKRQKKALARCLKLICEGGGKMLVGKYTSNIDSNGRLIFPVNFRRDMGENIVLAKSLFEKCLCAYSETEWLKLYDKLKEYPEAQIKDVKNWMHNSATVLTPDKQGRVFFPADLIKHAEFEKEVLFVGKTTLVEVWNGANYEEMCSKIVPENVTDILTKIGFGF